MAKRTPHQVAKPSRRESAELLLAIPSWIVLVPNGSVAMLFVNTA